MKSEILKAIKGKLSRGMALAIALCASALVAATVSGTINTFSTGDTLSASLMNENFASLKSAIESIDPQYNTAETLTHKVWIDGKAIYRKVFEMGAMPLATGNINKAHDIINLDKVVRISGFLSNGTTTLSLPYTASSAANTAAVDVNGTTVYLVNTGSFSGYNGVIILEYTKN